MDYEKKYKALIEAVKMLKEANPSDKGIQNWVNDNVPELKENEDERIRKELLNAFQESEDSLYMVLTPHRRESFIAWLEKQDKQPSAIKWYDVSLIPQEMEELLVEWDSEDATWHEIAFYHADTKTFWNGTRQVENVTRWCYITDLLEKQGSEENKGNLGGISPNSAWSEEDERNLEGIIDEIEANKNFAPESDLVTYDRYLSWLKSLRTKNTWKPSDEQMDSLETAVSLIQSNSLESLYQDLKREKNYE